MIQHLAVQMHAVIAEYANCSVTRIQVGGGWCTHTFREFGERIDEAVQGLLDQGVRPGGRTGLFASNYPEWSEIGFNAVTMRAIPVPIYTISTPEQTRHIAVDFGLRILFVSGRSECERVLKITDDLPELEYVVILKPWEDMLEWVIAYDDLRAEPEARALEARLVETGPDGLASVIYTSGTTGGPEGVMLRRSTVITQREVIEEVFHFGPEDYSLCFLSPSYVLERTWTSTILLKDCTNTRVPDARTVADALVQTKPTLLVSVPKLYEKVFATTHARVVISGIRRGIFKQALWVGVRNRRAYHKERRLAWFWCAQLSTADRLIPSSIRVALGGNKAILTCGGTPLRREVEELFLAAGIPTYTDYGLAEASPLVTLNSPDGFEIGMTGRVLKGGQLYIGEHGKVLFCGSSVMAEYWNNEGATVAAIDSDGRLHTGDAGYVDVNGFLVITDHIKDTIVISGGKNVAPQPIEGLILADPLFEHAVLFGGNRPCVTLLVKPSLPYVGEFGKLMQWPGEVADWLRSSELIEELRRRVTALTDKLPSQEKPRVTELMDGSLTTGNGLFTPTLKVCRRQVEKYFKELIDGIYETPERRRRSN